MGSLEHILFVALCTAVLSKADNSLFDTEGDPDLEDYLREAVENFRDQMKNGIPAISMPVLDPFRIEYLEQSLVQGNMTRVYFELKELEVNHLSHFEILDLQPNLEELYLQISLTLPDIFTSGHYNLSGSIYKLFPIYGEGHFDINATGIDIKGIGKLDFEGNNTLKMAILKLDLQWERLAIDFENLLGGGSFPRVLQQIIAEVGRDVFMAYKQLILDKIEKCLMFKVNEKLQQPAVKKVIEGILSGQE